MTPKEHLSRVKVLFDLIQQTETEISMLKASADGMQGFSYDKERVQTSLADTGLENQLVIIEQMESRLKDLRVEYQLVRERVTANIDKLTNERERKVLNLRYIEFKEWSDIFTEMNATQDVVYSLHKRALNHYRC